MILLKKKKKNKKKILLKLHKLIAFVIVLIHIRTAGIRNQAYHYMYTNKKSIIDDGLS